MLAIILAAALDAETACAKYKGDYTPPAVAAEAFRECGEDSNCYIYLSEEFANAEEGREQDLEIAEYFVCNSFLAQAEIEGMLEHIAAMRNGETAERLEFCDHRTSGYGGMLCMSEASDEEMPQLEARLDALRERVTAKKPYDALREKGTAYSEAEAERLGEQSRGGSGYAAISIAEEIDQRKRLVETMERWTEERAPAVTAAEAKRADEALNKAYRAELKRIEDAGDESILFWNDYLRQAQRAWIVYRDAFAAYYTARWKGAAPAGALRREIVTQLTRDRTDELSIDW